MLSGWSVTHDEQFSPFHEGSVANSGLESLCEEGKHQPLDSEIRAAVESGGANMLIETTDSTHDAPGEASTQYVDWGEPANPNIAGLGNAEYTGGDSRPSCWGSCRQPQPTRYEDFVVIDGTDGRRNRKGVKPSTDVAVSGE